MPIQESTVEEQTWMRAVGSYTKKNEDDHGRERLPTFMTLVMKRHPMDPQWFYRLRRERPCCANEETPEVVRELRDDDNFGFCVSLADVQRMQLRFLQGRLAWLALSAGFDDDCGIEAGALTGLGPALREYVQAVQDHEYMCRFKGRRRDPFRISSERGLERDDLTELMREKYKSLSDFRQYKPKAAPTAHWEKGDGPMDPIGGTRGEAFQQELWSRTAGALVGAAFLIGPMWALVLNQQIYLQLGVTTGCIMAFGLVMVWSLDTLDSVFAATLAYAAVLMVFVGVVMQGVGST